MMRTKNRTLQTSPAQGLVEFALILPLLVAVIFGIIELGILFSVYIGMTNSAREAARAGSVYQYTGTVPQSGDPAVTAAAIASIDQERTQYIGQIITDTINPLIDPATELTVTVSYINIKTNVLPENIYRAGDGVAVQLEYDHPLFFGLLGPKQIHVKATSSMRIEPGGKP